MQNTDVLSPACHVCSARDKSPLPHIYESEVAEGWHSRVVMTPLYPFAWLATICNTELESEHFGETSEKPVDLRPYFTKTPGTEKNV